MIKEKSNMDMQYSVLSVMYQSGAYYYDLLTDNVAFRVYTFFSMYDLMT